MPSAQENRPPPARASNAKPPGNEAGWNHPRYVLAEQLGQGGMGTVYRAKDRLTGAWVALKRVHRLHSAQPDLPRSQTAPGDETLPPQTGMSLIDARIEAPAPAGRHTQEATRQSLAPLARMWSTSPRDTLSSQSLAPLSMALAREFRTLASLRHPNIVSVFDYGFESPEQPFFTMELLTQAQPFLRVSRSRELTGRVTLLLEVLEALAYLHRRGILHRDLKPGNVLFCDGRVVVLDFGLSVLRALLLPSPSDLSGTLSYMAPELLLGQPASEATDLYAFGVMATQVLTGRYPFEAEQSALLVSRVLNTDPDLSGAALPEPILHVLEALLDRNPAQRLADATQAARALAQAVGIPLPAESTQVRESYLQAADFVGRDRELGLLRKALDQMQRSHGALWLIGGESGVGKSRLLDELRTVALVQGAHVDRGQAIAEGGSAYQVFADVLRSTALSIPLSPLEAGTLGQVVPDLPKLLDRDIDPPPTLDAQATHARLQSVLCDLLLRHSEPTLLILEDLHWAAADSRELLARLQPALAERPLLIVASYRNDECPQLPDELPGARALQLERLSPRGTEALIASMLGSAGQRPALVQWLREQTEGNPFFLVEILRALAEEAGSLTRVGIPAAQGGPLRGGMARVIHRRLSRMPDWALPALRQAAIAGRRIDRDLMRALMRASEAELDRWLAAGADAAVLDVQNEHWQFAHDKLREGVLAELRPDETQALHRQVAAGIEQSHPASPDVAAALAFHLQQGGDRVRAFPFALTAAAAAVARGALREALTLLQQAQSLEPDAAPALLLRVRLRRLLGSTLLGLGHIDDCMRITEEGLQLLRLPLPVTSRQLARGLLSNLATQGSLRLREHLPHLPLRLAWDRGLSVEEGREALGLLAAHAEVALYLFSDRRLFFCSLALANLAERLSAVPQQILGYSSLAYAAATYDLPAVSRLYLQKADALRRTVPGSGAEFTFLRVRGSIFISQGHLTAAEADLRAADAIAEAIGDSTSRMVALQQILWIRLFQNHVGLAHADLDTFQHLAERERHGQFGPRAQVFRALQQQQADQHLEATRGLELALLPIRATRDLTFELFAVALHARSALSLGRVEAARADTDILLSIFLSSPILNYGVLPAAYAQVDVCLALLERAQPLLRAQRRAQLDRALVVLGRLARHHRIARPTWLRAQARLLRLADPSAPRAQALEREADALARQLEIP